LKYRITKMVNAEENKLSLNTLANSGTKKNRKRVGRGIGSGLGKTAGRGHKGQKSRSGGGVRLGFEGGQMPLQQRLPKFGFSSRVNNSFKEVNVKNIDGLEIVSLESLKEKKIIPNRITKVKIFGTHELQSKITVKGIKVTKGAKESIEKAGGAVEE
jgi:large subunit ribosomal protein L15